MVYAWDNIVAESRLTEAADSTCLQSGANDKTVIGSGCSGQTCCFIPAARGERTGGAADFDGRFEHSMKAKIIAAFPTLLAIGAVFALILVCAPLAPKPDDPQLLARAKITRTEAEQIVRKNAPKSTVDKTDLKDRNGSPVWVVQLTTPGKPNAELIEVDGVTGSLGGQYAENARTLAKTPELVGQAGR